MRGALVELDAFTGRYAKERSLEDKPAKLDLADRQPSNAGAFGSAIDMFVEAADNAEKGDLAGAQRGLERMRGALVELDALTSRYLETAGRVRAKCVDRSLEVTNRISTLNEREKSLEDEAAKLDPVAANLAEQSAALRPQMDYLRTQLEPMLAEIRARNWCNSDVGEFVLIWRWVNAGVSAGRILAVGSID